MRRLFSDEVLRFEVDGSVPVAIDMPTLWTHNITNTGNSDLFTMFWTNDIFDPARPDTYVEEV
jgi:UDP-2-acetamido-2,6-beta-L-arabino-hexul-4-ose reductase